MTTPYQKLHGAIQKYVYRRGWKALNEIQNKSVDPILQANCDVVIKAGTASGKTEAAFFPALTKIASDKRPGFKILALSPLKALIDDQYKRLDRMCSELDIEVTPWHGDVNADRKNKIKEHPNGVVIITPESLEALLFKSPSKAQKAFANLQYIIIDEFHAFMGSSRGMQLLSQLTRIEHLVQRTIPRIALSATFSQGLDVRHYLRPNNTSFETKVIEATSYNAKVSIQIRGYEYEFNNEEYFENDFDRMHVMHQEVCKDIYRLMRGKNNLIFMGSRQDCEVYCVALRDLCVKNKVPNEFFVHHAFIDKEYRKELEKRLSDGSIPTTVFCTSTLELGIDIANVEEIGQIGRVSSISSLRQRLGRSGRRSGKAILRLFVPQELDSVSLSEDLCLDTFFCAANIHLLLNKWYEEPEDNLFLSTLVQQIISTIAQYGSILARDLFVLLCHKGPFVNIKRDTFVQVLKDLGEHNLIEQLGDNSLALSAKGNELVSSFRFFVTFDTEDDFIVKSQKDGIIGRISAKYVRNLDLLELSDDTCLMLAGKKWQIVHINAQDRSILVKPSNKTHVLKIDSNQTLNIDAKIYETVYAMLKGELDIPPCLDAKALELIKRGQEQCANLDLCKRHFCEFQQDLLILPFTSTSITRTFNLILKHMGYKTKLRDGIIELYFCSKDNLILALTNLSLVPRLNRDDLLKNIRIISVDKFDDYLSRDLLELSYETRYLDIDGAYAFAATLLDELNNKKYKDYKS